jgi:hypothetical protein
VSAPLTKEQVEAYLNASHLCPYCKSNRIEAGDKDYSGNGISQEIECLSCERRWTDIYELVSVEGVE